MSALAPIISSDQPAIGAVSPVPGPLLSPRTLTSGKCLHQGHQFQGPFREQTLPQGRLLWLRGAAPGASASGRGQGRDPGVSRCRISRCCCAFIQSCKSHILCNLIIAIRQCLRPAGMPVICIRCYCGYFHVRTIRSLQYLPSLFGRRLPCSPGRKVTVTQASSSSAYCTNITLIAVDLIRTLRQFRIPAIMHISGVELDYGYFYFGP